ncbi:MAG: YbjQ family protein [Balneola sp.]
MNCDNCGKEVSNRTVKYDLYDTVFCMDCFKSHESLEIIENKRKEKFSIEKEVEKKLDFENVLLTTETQMGDLIIQKRLGIITSECVLGMNIFKDIFSGVRDIVGGKSESTQKILKDLREEALRDLKEEAFKKGANTVIGVDLDYSEFSGGGKSMLFLVASGTAVITKKKNKNSPSHED